MSPRKGELSPGFTTIERAIEIIKSDTRQNPVVDMDYIMAKSVWIEVNHNFRIPKIRRLSKDEIYKTKRGRLVEYEHTGDINVYIATSFEKELLKKTIADKFRELSGREYKAAGVRAMSTVADDGQGRDAVRPRANTQLAKEGQSIGDGATTISNGDFAV